MFDKSSGLVGVWARLIKMGVYKEDNVPALSNLKEAVHEALADHT